MNVTQRLLLALIISLEIALTQSITVNILVSIGCAGWMLGHAGGGYRLGRYLLVALIPVIGTFISFCFYGSGNASQNLLIAGVMASRIGALILIGGWFTTSLDVYKLMASLEQNLHLSTTFVYGILGAINFIPNFKEAIGRIRAAGMMRGESLSFWSPVLYFKAIVQALVWSQYLAMAMTAHGFQEGAQRSHYRDFPLPTRGWLIISVIFVLLQVALFSGYLK